MVRKWLVLVLLVVVVGFVLLTVTKPRTIYHTPFHIYLPLSGSVALSDQESTFLSESDMSAGSTPSSESTFSAEYTSTADSTLSTIITPSTQPSTTQAAQSNRGHTRSSPVKFQPGPASEQIVKEADTELQRQFLQHLDSLRYVYRGVKNLTCEEGTEPPCLQRPCNASFLPPEDRVKHMINTQYPIEKRYLKVLDGLTDQSGYADVIFITGASENHYEESLGVLKGLHTHVFPELERKGKYSYKFLCYDLGLTEKQRELMETLGGCTSVITVPFEDLPKSFHDLRTCAWKPLLIQANVQHSKVTLWMDASTRFHHGNMTLVLDHVMDTGVHVTSSSWTLASHVAAETLDYFHVQPCLLSAFREMAGGFIAVRNDQVVRQAVLGPWVSCAFSPQCLCPGDNCYDRLKPCTGTGRYSKCHRFDQAVLGLILVYLYDWRVSSFYGTKISSFHSTLYRMFPKMSLIRGKDIKNGY